ncbi:cytosine permease, partial [Rathayibacter sp. AY2B1]
VGVVDPQQANVGWKIAVAAVIMAVQVAISFLGYRAIAAFERWTVPPTLLVLAIMSVVAWFFLDIDWSYAGPAEGALTGGDRIAAMSIVMTAIGIGWGLTWLAYAGDYSRFVGPRSSKRGLYLASVLGQFIPVVWLGVLGATLATKNGSVDPGELIVENFGALAIPVLLLVVHGPIATNVLNIYSFGMATQALDIRLGRRALSLIVGVLAFAAAVFFVFQDDLATTLDAWLVGLVGWVAPWGAIVLVHYTVFEPRVRSFGHLFAPVGSPLLPDVRWRALLSFAIGATLTWLFMNGSVPALQGPAATALGGVDVSWLAGGVSAGLAYLLLGRDAPAWVERRESAAPVAAEPEPVRG